MSKPPKFQNENAMAVLLDALLERGVPLALGQRAIAALVKEDKEAARYRKAKNTSTISREVEEEFDIAFDADFERGDSSVGIGSGFVIENVIRLDTGEAIELTREEEERLAQGLIDSQPDAPDYED